ncbi:MAG: S-layer homology domain-containing protein [Candidatus Saganbacteria bacterium]|nr:S-layer homology domain-containing protein [Candidatus Saganbacteria bacterium]
MKRTSVLALCFLLLSSVASAGIFIYEPKDKGVAFEKVVMLKGVAKDVSRLTVNGQQLQLQPDGSFACGLVLRRGKNYVDVRAVDAYGQVFDKQVRILGLKSYPDIETLYEGKKHWARQQIVYLSSLGFIEGYPDDNFYPGNPITRGELATWLARIKKLSIPALTEDVFFDVPKEHWRAPYVKAVVDAGYMQGYDNQTFGLEDPISRRQAASIAVLAEGIDVVDKTKPLFIDVPKTERGAFPIYIGKEKGLLRGVSEDIPVYEPERALTRAEATILLSRFKRSQNAVQWLFNYSKGFAADSYCPLNIAPQMISFSINPETIQANEQSTVALRLTLGSRDNFAPIAKVKVDLSELGGMPDVLLFDDGSHGDQVSGDLIYSLNVLLEPKESGSKPVRVTAVDKLGWESAAEAWLTIVE